MRALVQRVTKASVTINGTITRSIGPGLLILLGVHESDTPQLCPKLADKTAGLRIFSDDKGKMNLSAIDKNYSAMVVSQFTLYGDTKKGKRPSFISAAKPELGQLCYKQYVHCLKSCGLADVQTGEFGANMQIELVNDGPVTLMLDTEEW